MPQRRNTKVKSRFIKHMQELTNLKQLPTNNDVLLRRNMLQQQNIGKAKSIFLMELAKKIHAAWEKQDMPVQGWRAIYQKLRRRVPPPDQKLFDCLPKNPIWKTKEDQLYYDNQKNGLGGYCTSTKVAYKVHPSKVPRKSAISIKENLDDVQVADSDNEVEDCQVSDESCIVNVNDNKIGDVSFAERLREAANISINQTLAVMNFYKAEFKDVETIPFPPARSSISRTSRINASIISDNIQNEEPNQTLYFDMKQYGTLYGKKREVICVCIGNQLVDFQELTNKKAGTITSFLLSKLAHFSVSRIVADTEPTVTGATNGIVSMIKKDYPEIIYEPCRLHILDLILKHQISFCLGCTKQTSPNLPYAFVNKIALNWHNLRNTYLQITRSPPFSYPDLPSNEHRRDDYRFLLELTKALRTYRENGQKPLINIPTSPVNISSARWNSRAIYCLMDELVVGNMNENIIELNTFISYEWAPVWFGVRSITDWSKLVNLCEKAKNVIIKHGLINKLEYKPPTNEFPERVFRMANEKIPRCKTMTDLRNSLIRYVNYSPKLCKN